MKRNSISRCLLVLTRTRTASELLGKLARQGQALCRPGPLQARPSAMKIFMYIICGQDRTELRNL